MVACYSDVEVTAETEPDTEELVARCNRGQDSLSELARAVVRLALESHVMPNMLAAALGGLEIGGRRCDHLDGLSEAPTMSRL